ncbi:MAG: sigma-70 family RNA polymerase sigma factor [Planctomycetota bacterium]|nr:sigma-70 family RNA polymerase sigma factor [Planctomycetota bacterium]
MDHRRGRRRAREASASTAASEATTDAPTSGGTLDGPIARLVASEEARLVRGALAQLEPGQRRAIEMSFFDGLSHAQIAEQLGRPLGTVKTLIRQSLIELRQSVRILDKGSPGNR